MLIKEGRLSMKYNSDIHFIYLHGQCNPSLENSVGLNLKSGSQGIYCICNVIERVSLKLVGEEETVNTMTAPGVILL